jgi:ribonuclease P protein component
MLTRRHRLTKSDNVSGILKSGGMASSKFLVARFRKSELKHNRFSVIVSNKIDSKAVNRNRVRRQIYELLRLNLDKFSADQHFDILILPKKAIIGATYEEIEKQLLKILPHIQ